MKDEGENYVLSIRIDGISPDVKTVKVQQEDIQTNSIKLLKTIILNSRNEFELSLKKSQSVRYLWTIEK
jgi:hypothetical protein